MDPSRALAVGTALCLVLVAGCAGEQPTTNPPSAVHTHAGDGHAMDAVPEPPASADWNAADATYLSMMVAHHSQAIDLTELAAERAVDRRVRKIATGIDAGQGREVLVMAAWLVDHDLPEPTVEGVAAMTEHGMPGMLTTAQVDALAATDGTEFDRRFLEDMIQHHQGAVAMAEQQVVEGEDVRATEMATDVIASQNAEITRMRELLRQLP
ncbi:DUF305 domain-containing protein [Nocardioides sp. 1609]|uniref:DUF305 domain-containing protein n=1 Tax=Nocardioides sp. 1609 TaxID=2508327 RepID=UPI00106FC9C8|nr:DUF305 domain-containing protein [Nocardioides sp. 1609]